MNTMTQRSIAVTFVVIGIAMGAIGLVLDLNGGPSALHVLTWIGGGLFGYGFVLFMRSGRSELK